MSVLPNINCMIFHWNPDLFSGKVFICGFESEDNLKVVSLEYNPCKHFRQWQCAVPEINQMVSYINNLKSKGVQFQWDQQHLLSIKNF